MTFEEWAVDALPKLLGMARAICGQGALAEDLLQDVLIKVHARWDGIDPNSREAYVRRCVVNELISWRRKWSRQIPTADPGPSAQHYPPDETTAIVERDALLAELARLPTRQRAVLGLRYYLDLSDEQIAADLGCAASTVRAHASRALATLRIRNEFNFSTRTENRTR